MDCYEGVLVASDRGLKWPEFNLGQRIIIGVGCLQGRSWRQR